MPQWIEAGHRRAEAAKLPPFNGASAATISTDFVITRGRCPGPYARLPATDVTGRFRVSRQNARRPAWLLRRGAA